MLFAQQWWKFCAAHKTSQRGTRPAFEMDYYFQQLLYTSFVCSVFLLRRRRTTYTTETLKTVLVGESPRFFLHHQKNYLLRIVAISQINPRKRIVKNRKHEFWNVLTASDFTIFENYVLIPVFLVNHHFEDEHVPLRMTNVAFFRSLTFSVCYSEADLRRRSQSRRGGRHPWARYLVAEETESPCQIQPSCSSKMSQSGQVPSHVLVDYHSGLFKHLRPGYWTLPTACMAGWLPEYHQPLLHCALYLRNVHQDVQSWLSSEFHLNARLLSLSIGSDAVTQMNLTSSPQNIMQNLKNWLFYDVTRKIKFFGSHLWFCVPWLLLGYAAAKFVFSRRFILRWIIDVVPREKL